MATQPAAPAPGNGGGNHLGLDLRKQTLSLQSQNLVLILFIIGVGLLSWERSKTLATHLDRVQATQTQLLDAIHTGDAALEAVLHNEVHALREVLLTQQLTMQKENHEERTALSQALAAHGQQSQAAHAQMHQCAEEMAGLVSLLRQRGVGP